VSGRDGSAQLLESLCAVGALVFPLDHERCWYRCHNLFTRALRARLEKLYPDRVPLLHAQAGRWFKENDLPAEAVRHAILARDWAFAASLVSRYAMISFLKGESATVMQWVQSLPPRVIGEDPSLCVIRAWALFFRNLEGRAGIPLDMIEQCLDSAEVRLMPPGGAQRDAVACHADALRVFLAFERGEPPGAFVDRCRRNLAGFGRGASRDQAGIHIFMGMALMNMGEAGEASKALDKAASIGVTRDAPCVAGIADSLRALLAKITGRLGRAEAICRPSMAMAREPFIGRRRPPPEMLGFMQTLLALILLERNSLDDAEELAGVCGAAVRLAGNIHAAVLHDMLLVRIRLIRGAGLPELFSVIAGIEKLEHACPGARAYAESLRVGCLVSRCWNNPPCLETALHLAEQYGLRLECTPRGYSHPFALQWRLAEALTAARLIVEREYMQPMNRSREKLEQACSFLEGLSEKAGEKGLAEVQLHARILAALAHHARGDQGMAAHALAGAFSLAEPEGCARPFIDRGPPMAELIRSSHGAHGPFAGAILSSIEGELKKKHHPDGPAAGPAPQIEPLSRQETVILGLVAQGMTNQEIADKLCVALTTVKTHNYNIYGKLGVNRRYLAVKKARELGMI
jgi:LuxR family transcriptional regulator, maltose regulon positive regulatory protein